MKCIKDLVIQRLFGDPGTIVWSVYSVNKFLWLINKPYVGECGRCLWKRKSCVTAALWSLGRALKDLLGSCSCAMDLLTR